MDDKIISQIETVPDEVFDTMMGQAPPKASVTEETIVGGTPPPSAQEENEEDKNKAVTKSDEELAKEVNSVFGDDDEEEEEEEEDKGKKPGASKKSDKPKQEAKQEESNIDVAEFLKNKALGLIESGAWFDLEEGELDEIEWNEETYMDLAIKQAEWKAEAQYEDKKNHLGKYKILIEHIENGGNPDDLITILQEAKEIEDIDKSTEEGKVALLRRYYVDELGWSAAKFKKYSTDRIDDATLDAEVEEVEGFLDKSRAKRIEEKRKEQEEYNKKQEDAHRRFAATIQQTVTSIEGLSKKEQSEIVNNLLVYNQKLPDGRLVNKFTLDFMQLQADPKKYIDLVRFVQNPEKFIEKVATKASSETAKKDWKLIKGSNAVRRNTGTTTTSSRGNTDEDLKIDFRKLI